MNFYSLAVNKRRGPAVRVSVSSSLMLQYFLHQTQEVVVNTGMKQTVASNGETLTKLTIKPPHFVFFPFPAQRKRPEHETTWEGEGIKPSSCTSQRNI